MMAADTLEVRILGCGSSGGVPRLGGPDEGGNWGDCDPANPKNRRRRCSILVKRKAPAGETRVLVDTAPDLREHSRQWQQQYQRALEQAVQAPARECRRRRVDGAWSAENGQIGQMPAPILT